jgi:hypothetical protein
MCSRPLLLEIRATVVFHQEPEVSVYVIIHSRWNTSDGPDVALAQQQYFNQLLNTHRDLLFRGFPLRKTRKYGNIPIYKSCALSYRIL